MTGELFTPPVVNVVCYSYKGGSGRSTAAVNIALQLARRGNLVALLDMDIDAPGQHMLIADWLSGALADASSATTDGEPDAHSGIARALRKLQENNGAVGIQNFFNTPISEVNPLSVLEAGTLDLREVEESYIMDSSQSDVAGELEFFFASTERRPIGDLEKRTISSLEEFLEKYRFLQKRIAGRLYHRAVEAHGRDSNDPRVQQVFLVVDAPNGVNNISLPLLKSADLILTFFRHSVQHVQGTLETVRKLYHYLERELNKRYLRILLVGSCYPEELETAVRALHDDNERHNLSSDTDIERMWRKFEAIRDSLQQICAIYPEIRLLPDSIPEVPLLKVLEQPITRSGLPMSALFPARKHLPGATQGISEPALAKLSEIASVVSEVGYEIGRMKVGQGIET